MAVAAAPVPGVAGQPKPQLMDRWGAHNDDLEGKIVEQQPDSDQGVDKVLTLAGPPA
jgi:hypothetical protein